MRTAMVAAVALLTGCQAGKRLRAAKPSTLSPPMTSCASPVDLSGTVRSKAVPSYATPENPDGTRFAVERFSGLNGAGYSGTLDGATFDLTITPGTCSDDMSDRSYPYTATLLIGDEMREGCAWTDRQPFSGPRHVSALGGRNTLMMRTVPSLPRLLGLAGLLPQFACALALYVGPAVALCRAGDRVRLCRADLQFLGGMWWGIAAMAPAAGARSAGSGWRRSRPT